jgi:hypothetical protein
LENFQGNIMKKLIPVFAIAALAACTQPVENTMEHYLETRVADQPGQYTFLPLNDPFDSRTESGTFGNLVIKLDQHDKTGLSGSLLCARFKIIVTRVTPQGQYLLPYERSVNGGADNSSSESTEIALRNFDTGTLLNIPEYIESKDGPNDSYSLTRKISEICVVRPAAIAPDLTAK